MMLRIFLAEMIYELPPLTDLAALDAYLDKLQESERLLRANLTAANTRIGDQEKLLLKFSDSNSHHSIFDFGGSSIVGRLKSLAALRKGQPKQVELNSTTTENLSGKNAKKITSGVSREALLKTVKLLRKKLVDSEDSKNVLLDEIVRLKNCNEQTEESYGRLRTANYQLESLIFER